MAVSQQVLHSMSVVKLKNLIDLEISFEGSQVTAILGPNGNGKSTILHALACAYSPSQKGENYKFSKFFLPNTDALWNESELSIIHSYRDDKKEYKKVNRGYKKTSVRWTPRYASRPEREIYYIGIDKCVPMIESEKKQAKINYSTQEINEEIINEVLDKASLILNRKYTGYNIHTASGKDFIGVEVDGLRYSALSMSAGEQKIFYILETIFRAKKYSLILIDELDLLLHDRAMKRLVEVVLERAIKNNLQVIFTTHRESILELEGKVNIRHIVSKPGKTLCFNETKPDAINRLTGSQPRPLEVFVEDDFAYNIVKKIAAKLGLVKYISVTRYGAAINCFTTVGGLMLGGDNCNNSIFVLDGDVHSTEAEKAECLKRVLTGHDENVLRIRSEAIGLIKQFVLPGGQQPEKYAHSILITASETDNDEINEIIEVARDIVVAENDHKYIDEVIERLGWDKNIGLSKIVDILEMSPLWDEYVSEIKSWMQDKADKLKENPEFTSNKVEVIEV